MKKLYSIFVILFLIFTGQSVLAQQIGDLKGIHFQAVAIDDNGKEIIGMDINGKPVYNKTIGVRFSILSGSSGPVLYQETHSTLTDQHGLFSLVIGQGDLGTEGPYPTLMEIPWIDADQFLKVEIAINNDGNYKLVSLQQFMAVPYSFYTDDIADDAITTAKIRNEEILSEDIKDETIVNADIANETVDLTAKVTNTLPVANGGTGLSEITPEGVVVGNGTDPLTVLSMPDNAQVLTKRNGNTDLYALQAGPRTSITYDDVSKTVTITALEQGTEKATGVGSAVNIKNLLPGGQIEKEFPINDLPVALGDILIASISQNLKGLTLTAYVSVPSEVDADGKVTTAGKVVFVFYNGSGDPVTLDTFSINMFNLGQ